MADSPIATVKENWRVFLLVLIVSVSMFALFSPTLADEGNVQGPAAGSGPTNLVYGLELSGGTRIRAPLVGVHATGVQVQQGTNASTVQADVAANLENATKADVTVRFPGKYRGVTQRTTVVEVTTDNVTRQELRSALQAGGYWGDTTEVQDGVSAVTRKVVVGVLSQKVNDAGLSGGTVQTVTTASNQHYVVIEVPNENRSAVLDLVESRGQVLVQAYHPVNGSDNYTRTTLMTSDDLKRVNPAQPGEGRQPPYVPIVVKDKRAEAVQQKFVKTGVAQQGGTTCTYQKAPNSTEPCILVVQDGEVINSFGMSPDLARSMRKGQWAKDPGMILQTQNFSEAQELAVNLRAGALPAKLDLSEDSSMYISPAQSQGFKRDSLLAGLVAVLAVSGVVFARYRRVEVAGPMVITALSEVIILLGLAAAFEYPLDLSVIAGFIAAIGTGVDDLIIIADEVMSEGEVNSRRVFQSRFRKAFWVIGAAAATTVIALSPLAVLSLGDLKGFAIFTILGVLVGVLVTRPAYGDILRSLLTIDR